MTIVRHSLALACLVASFAAACGAPGEKRTEPEEAGQRPDAPRWSLEPLWTSSDTLLLSGVLQVAVDSHDRLYAFDRDLGLFLLSPEGHVIRRIGRKGEGPGEYGFLFDLQIIEGDTLLAWDAEHRRLTAFEPEFGRFAYDRSPVREGAGGRFGMSPPRSIHRVRGEPERYLAVFPPLFRPPEEGGDRSWVVRVLDGSGAVLQDSVLTFPAGRTVEVGDENRYMSIDPPFSAHGIVEVGPDDRIHYAHTDTVRIRILDVEGREVGGFEFHRRRTAVTDEDIEDTIEAMTNNLPPSLDDVADEIAEGIRDLAPDHHPLLGGFLIDDRGRVWIPPYHPPSMDTPPLVEWEVYSPDGRLLGILPVEQGFLREVRGDRAYGIMRDSMGVPTLWAARIRADTRAEAAGSYGVRRYRAISASPERPSGMKHVRF